MNKADRNWIGIIILAVALIIGLCASNAKGADLEPDNETKCVLNAKDLSFTADRIKDIKQKFETTTDDREKFVLSIEGTNLEELQDFLTKWRYKHCIDI